jgi:hypothetical protein
VVPAVSDQVGALLAELDQMLRGVAEPQRAVQEKRYLKSALVHLGVSVPSVRRAVREFAEAHGGMGREELWELVRALWATGVYEHRAAAVELLEQRSALLGRRTSAISRS